MPGLLPAYETFTKQMTELTPKCPSGAVVFCQRFRPADWYSITGYLKTEGSFDDYVKFRTSLMDVYTSLTLSTVHEHAGSFAWFSWEELKRFKRLQFDAYVLSSGCMRHDTDVSAMLRDGMQGFCPPTSNGDSFLAEYASHLDELHSLHQFFACRKALAKCDFIKWDSDFEEIFQRLESEKKWTELSDCYLRYVLSEHFSFLRKWNDNLADMDVGSAEYVPEGDKLLDAINKEYSKQLFDLTKEFQEMSMRDHYVNHCEFMFLQHRCVDRMKASINACLPKDSHLTTPKFFQQKERLLVTKNRILETISKLKVQARGSYGGPTRLPGLMFITAVAFAALGIASMASR